MNFQNFYREREAYFESGIVRKIYSSEQYCVCSVSDLSYVLFNYSKSETGGHIGMIISKDLVKLLVDNEQKFSRILSGINPRELDKKMLVLGNSNFMAFKKLKEERDIKGPSPNIDLQMEEELMAKNKSR